jgi:hypothetical protein
MEPPGSKWRGHLYESEGIFSIMTGLPKATSSASDSRQKVF